MKAIHCSTLAASIALAVFLVAVAGLWCPPAAAAAPQFIRGDANDDGAITLADVIYVATYLYGGGPVPLPVPDSGDVDCDRDVDLVDVVRLVDYIVRNGPAPGCPI